MSASQTEKKNFECSPDKLNNLDHHQPGAQLRRSQTAEEALPKAHWITSQTIITPRSIITKIVVTKSKFPFPLPENFPISSVQTILFLKKLTFCFWSCFVVTTCDAGLTKIGSLLKVEFLVKESEERIVPLPQKIALNLHWNCFLLSMT